MKKLFLFAFILLLALYGNVEAATYYIGTGGTHASWNAAVGSLGDGDTLAYKCGEVFYEESHSIPASNITITSWYLDDDEITRVLGVNEDGRPIIDGGWDFTAQDLNYNPDGSLNASSSIFYAYGKSDITIKNLEIRYSKGKGILFTNTCFNITVNNCVVHHCINIGIQFSKYCYDFLVENSYVYIVGLQRYFIPGSNIPASIGSTTGCHDFVFRGNKIYSTGGEGYGAYHNCYDGVIEDNVAVNTKMGIYTGGGYRFTIRRNLVVRTADGTKDPWAYDQGDTEGRGIGVYDEGGTDPDLPLNSDHDIYSNVVIGCHKGIDMAKYDPVSSDFKDVKVFNNTVINCTTGIFYDRIVTQTYSGNEIKNNVIWTDTGGTPSDFHDDIGDVNYNLWCGDGTPDSNTVGVNDIACTGDPGLYRTAMSYFNAITPSTLPTIVDVAPQVGSEAINSGDDTLVSPYNRALDPVQCDYASIPFTVVTGAQADEGTGFEVGAVLYLEGEGGGGEPPPEGSGNDYSGDSNTQAHFQFESGALTTDSIGSYTLTDHGTVTADTDAGDYWVLTGQTASALFNGTDQYFSRTGSAADFGWNSSSELSVTGRFKITSIGTNRKVIFAKTDTGEACIRIAVDVAGQLAVSFGINSGANWSTVTHTSVLSENILYFFAITLDSSLNYRIRIKTETTTVGTDLTGTVGGAVNLTEAGDIYIGAQGGSYPFPGNIDDIVIFDDVLTVEEIDQIWGDLYDTVGGGAGGGGGGFDCSTDSNCKALYSQDDGAITTDSKDSYTLTNNNSVTADTDVGDFIEGDASGEYNGSNQYLSLAGSADQYGIATSDEFTISFWFNVNDHNNPYAVFAKEATSNLFLRIYINYDQVYVKFGNGASWDLSIEHATTCDSNTWYQGFVSYDGNASGAYIIRLYDEDGNHIGTDLTGTTAVMTNSNAAVYIGRSAAGQYFNGHLDRIIIWDAALSANDMDAVVNPAPADPVLAAAGTWDFQEAAGSRFSSSRTLDIGIGDSVYPAWEVSEQMINIGNPEAPYITYQVDYPVSTNYFGPYIGQYTENSKWYIVFEIRGGYSFVDGDWVAVNAMRESSDLAISSIDMGEGYMRDGDGNDLDTTITGFTDPGTITISCPGVVITTDPTAEYLLDSDIVVIPSGSAAWSPTEDYLTVIFGGAYSGDVDLSGVAASCKVINYELVSGSKDWGSCTPIGRRRSDWFIQ